MNLSSHLSRAQTAEVHLKEEWGSDKDIKGRILIGKVKASDDGWVVLDLFAYIGRNGKEVETEQIWRVAIPTGSIAFMYINEVSDNYKELRKKRGTLATYQEGDEQPKVEQQTKQEPTGIVEKKEEPSPDLKQMKEPPPGFTPEELGKSGEDIDEKTKSGDGE